MALTLGYFKDNQGQCPLWVKSGHVQRKKPCPLWPNSEHRLLLDNRRRGREMIDLIAVEEPKPTKIRAVSYGAVSGHPGRWE
jgi:hypothetical protein